ncbi:MAG: ICP22 family protein, partial [Planctomycetota bacterium]
YVDEAEKNSGDANRESINAEAERIFEKNVLEGLKGYSNVKVLPLHTGKTPRSPDDPFGRMGVQGKVLDLEQEGLEGLLSAIETLFPGAPRPWAVEKGAVAPGSPGLHEVLAVQGTGTLGLVGWGPQRTEISLKGPEGIEISPHSFGGRGRFRVFLLPAPGPGLYGVTATTAEGGDSGDFALAAYRSLKYRVAVEVREEKDILFSGDVLPVVLSATWGDPPVPVTEETTLGQMQAEISVVGPDGKPEVKTVGFGQNPSSTVEIPVPLGDGGWEGSVELTAVLRVFPLEGGGHEFESAPVKMTLDVIPGSTAIEIGFKETSVLSHQEARIEGKLLRGRPPEGPVEIELSPEGEGKSIKVVLYGGEKPDQMWGKVRSSEAGTWKIASRTGRAGAPSVLPGPQSTLVVRPRRVYIENKEGGAFHDVETASIPYFITLPEGGKQGAHLFIRGDLAEGEKGSVRLDPSSLKGWKMKVLAGDGEVPQGGVEISGDATRAELLVVLEPAGAAPNPGTYDVGNITPVLIIAGLGPEGKALEIKGEAAVKVLVESGPAPWYMNPILWALAGALLLLLLLLIWLFTGTKFQYQNLVLQGDEGTGKAPFFFIDNTYGFKKQKAVGTEEVEEAVRVRVKSGGRCYISAAAADVEIRVNGRKVAGHFALAEGNLVEVQRGDEVRTYRYFAQPAAPEDLLDDEFVIMEYDQDDDFIIADDEDVPEYVPGPVSAQGSPQPPIEEHEIAEHGWVGDGTEDGTDQEEGTSGTPSDESEAAGPGEQEFRGESMKDGLGEGTLEEIAPQGEMQMDDLVTEKPPSELVTADPLVFSEEVREVLPPSEEGGSSAMEMDDGATLMGIGGDGPITADDVKEAAETRADEPPQEDGGYDDAVTLLGISSEGQITSGDIQKAMKPPADAGAPDFDDQETFLGGLTQDSVEADEEGTEEPEEPEEPEETE